MHLDCPRCGRVLEYSDRRPAFCAYCGKPLPQACPATAPLQPDPEAATRPPIEPAPCGPAHAERVGGYRLLRALGTGGMGTVYEAEEPATGRRIALKLISPEFAGSHETVARFRQEGWLASQVVHPRCVFVHKADEEAGLPYIVMELMPGSTLQDLVQERGPLAPEDAVTKILDVIEGLQEAHRLGIIHRDVKPSNCFLEKDGRVKVGDFGLARSLLSDARLTRAGAFLGTPLYASPEQIRADPVDPQTDVYSVAATLYFLLAGRAPHQTGDAAATMARIVSEDPPSLRTVRPELAAALDEVVLRGLERDRGRRWANLEEFRQALVPFAPGRLPAAGLAPRLAAFFVDWLLLASVAALAQLLCGRLTAGSQSAFPVWLYLANTVLWLGYFGILEGVWGASPGKWLFRLRVCSVSGCDPPGLLRAVLRAAVLEVLVRFGPHLSLVLLYALFLLSADGRFDLWLPLTLLGAYLLGPIVPLVTMRVRNGYRGLHELVSGTRVITLTPPDQRLPIPSRRLEQEISRPAGLPERLGPYQVFGVLAEEEYGQVLLGQDPAVGRKTLLWVRGASAPPLPPVRQELARGSRLRWLMHQSDGEQVWDAFVAPAGCTLADLTAHHGRLPWAEVRPLLEQLTHELAAAQAEQSMPRSLEIDQVWVQPDGRVCLLEVPLGREQAPPLSANPVGSEDEQALSLVRHTAVLALEGASRRTEDTVTRIRTPLPGSAARVLDRLFHPSQPYSQLKEWQQDMAELHDQLARVTPAARLAHLEVLTVLLSVGLIFLFLVPTVLFVDRAAVLEYGARQFDRLSPFIYVDAAVGTAFSDPVSHWAAAPCLWYWQDRIDRGDELRRSYRQASEAFNRSRSRLAAELMGLWYQVQYVDSDDILPARHPAVKPAFQVTHIVYSGSISWSRRQFYRAASERWYRVSRIEDLEYEIFVYSSVVLIPVTWIAWAFLFRGGFSYCLAGLALVRHDGRPAARWQCGLRALLVWAPVVGLLCFSHWLNSWQVLAAFEGRVYTWAPWLSWASWWLGVLLLPAYAWLALWLPERSLHDRIVGTYLVPR